MNLESTSFVNALRDKYIDSNSLSLMRSNRCVDDTKFNKIAEGIKQLSGAVNGDSTITPCHSWQAINSITIPSPLVNVPLAGKKIKIRQKSNFEGMWRPSQAALEDTTNSDLKETISPNAVPPPLTGFCQKPWCELVKLSSPYNFFSTSIASEQLCASVSNNANDRSFGDQKLKDLAEPSLNPVSKSNDFYEEFGVMHIPIPRNKRTEADSWYSVSCHAPVKARQRHVPSVMSKFHLYQTVFSFEDKSSEPLRQDLQCSKLSDCKKYVVRDESPYHRSDKRSEDADVLCSIVSTGTSNVSYRDRQLQDDIQDDTTIKKADLLSVLCGTYKEEINNDFACTCDSSEICVEAKTLDRTSDKAQTEMDNKNDFGVSLKDRILKLKDLTEVSSDKRIQWKLLEVDSDFKEGCRYYEANVRYEDTNVKNTIKPVETKLKKSSRSPHMPIYSKMCTNRAILEDRKTALQRLTRLPLRCKINSQNSLNSYFGNDRVNTKELSFISSKPLRDVPLSTINLKLDFTLKQQKCTPSHLASISRKLTKHHYPVANHDHIESVNMVNVPEKHFDYLSGISAMIDMDNMTECPDVPKNILAESQSHFQTSSTHMFINGSSLESKDALWNRKVVIPKDSNDVPILSKTMGTELHLKEHNNAEKNHEANKMDKKVNDVGLCISPVSKVVEKQIASSSGLEENVTPQENKSNTLLNLDHASTRINRMQIRVAFNALLNTSVMSKPPITHEVRFREVQTSRNEDAISDFNLRSRCSTACSGVSLDDVPYNSPAGSCRGSSISQMENLNYTKDVVRSHQYQAASSTLNLSSNDRFQNGNRHDIRHKSDSPDVQQTKTDFKSYETNQGVDNSIHNNLYLNDQDNFVSKNHSIVLEATMKQEIEDDTDDYESSEETSQCSPDSAMSSTADGFPYSKVHAMWKTRSDSEEEIHKDIRRLEPRTNTYQLPKNRTLVEISTSQQEDYSCQKTETQFTEHYAHPHDSQLERRKTHQETVGQVSKNVRFSDEDKVISFRNFDNTFQDNIPPVEFYPVVPHVNTTFSSNAIKHYEEPRKNPVLHTQKLQLETLPMINGRNQERGRRFVHYRQMGNNQINANFLRDVNWSSYSYKTSKRREGGMCVKGRSLTSQVNTNKSAPSEVGLVCNDNPVSFDNTVMYTICKKCEAELHMKFENDCNAGSLKLKDIVEIPVGQKVSRVLPREKVRCGHKDTGYCELCTNVMSWALC